ncbi:MAG: alpha/beta hydrolase, partial [Proteobacteria bacterium]
DISSAKPNGKAVVLLHGKNFSGNYWESTIKSLTTSGYRVIVPDQIGFGKSSKPDHLQYSFQLLSQLTLNLLDSLKIDKFSIVGHSMGGMLATRMSLMYPARVEKLALVNPLGLEDWKLRVPYQSVDTLYQGELQQTEDKIRDYQKANYFDGQWKPEYENQMAILAGWTKHPEYKKVAWNAALTAEMIMTQPVLYEFKNLDLPTLLIIGTRDKTALGKNLVDEKTRTQMGLYEKLGRETQKQFLTYCMEMFRQALLLNYQATSLVYVEPRTESFKLENFAPFVHGNNIQDIFREISAAQYHIERNGSAKMILTDLSIKLTRLIHKK